MKIRCNLVRQWCSRWCSRWLFSHCQQMRECGMHPISLHFLDPGQEQGYVAARSPQLMAATTTVIAVMVLCVVALVPMLRFSRSAHPSDEAFEISKVRYMFCVVAAVLWLISGTFAKFQQCHRRLSPWARELFVGLFAAVNLWICITFSEWHMAGFLGYDPIQAFGQNSNVNEGTLLLAIVAAASFFHWSLPLRWTALLLAEASCALMYPAILACFGTSEVTGTRINVVLVTSLVLGLSLGKRKLEHFERLAFRTIVSEKTKRAQAEFMLSMHPQRFDDQEPVPDCATSKADTADLFNNLSENANLVKVAGLGSREHWLVNTKDIMLQPGRRLGQGSFGVVVAGSFLGTPVAVKLARGPGPSSSVQGLPQLANELRVLRRVRHPNIVLFHGGCVDVPNKALAVVLELIRGDVLNDFLNPGKVPPGDGERYIVLLGIARGLTHLHTQCPCVVHGDVSDGNIMVERLQHEPRAKLLDFGLSRILSPKSRPLGGTCRYMAPEVLKGHMAPSVYADVFSFGRIVFHVAVGQRPWHCQKESTITAFTISGNIPKLDWPEHPFAQLCMTVAKKCTQFDPARRSDMWTVVGDLAQWPERLDMSIHGASMMAHLGAARSSPSMEWNTGIQELCATESTSAFAVLPDQMLHGIGEDSLSFQNTNPEATSCEGVHSSFESRTFHLSEASGPNYRDV